MARGFLWSGIESRPAQETDMLFKRRSRTPDPDRYRARLEVRRALSAARPVAPRPVAIPIPRQAHSRG